MGGATTASLARQRTELIDLLARSRRSHPSLPFPRFLRRPFDRSRAYRTLVRDYDIISHSPLFDPVWYVEAYENVAEKGEDPIHHFLKFGGEYALSPGPHFDTKAYLAEHPKLRDSGENPLLHFIRARTAKAKGRNPLDRLRGLFQSRPVNDAASRAASEYLDWIDACESQSPWAINQTGPRVSFLVVAAPDAAPAVARTLAALDALLGDRWEAVVAAGVPVPETVTAARIVRAEAGAGPRSAELSALLEAAGGDFFAVLDAGDIVSPHALQEFWALLGENPDLDLIYSDEDRTTATGERTTPFLKPDWSPEYLDAFNYFGRLTFVRASTAGTIGAFARDYDAAAEYDLALRLGDANAAIGRIARILCHRSPEAPWDRPSGEAAADHRRALLAHWTRRGIAATVTSRPDGTWHATWPLVDPPLVSVVIPNRDKPDLLRMALAGLLRGTDYPRLEIVIVDTLSTSADLAELYEEIGADERVRIVSFTEPFNYSAACNLGARHAHGSVLLFLNNDIEVTTPDWLSELVRCVTRPGVGIAGTMLVFPSGELQHAGVVVGMHGGCGLVFRAAALDEWGVFGSPSVSRNYLGIMGACQMIRRDVFELLGGFDETYQIANSDIALSIAAWRAGYRTVYSPHAKLIHHEGASRGHTNPTEDYARTTRDFEAFGILEDPYFNPALSSSLPIPTLCGRRDIACDENLIARRREQLAAYSEPARFDPADTTDVVLALGRDDAKLALWPPQSAAGIVDRWSAARFVIDLLRRDAELRTRFPTALSDGPDGDFARWLASGEGRGRFSLSPVAVTAMRAAFADAPGDLARRAYLFREDARAKMPLGTTPAGLRDLFVWLMAEARRTGAPRIESVWWFALECVERPALEFVRAYLFNPVWQRIYPDGLTVFGRGEFLRWLKVMYRIDDDWLDPARWPTVMSPADEVRLAYHRRDFWQRMHPDAFASPSHAQALLTWLDTDEAGTVDEACAWLRMRDTPALAAELARSGANVFGHFRYPSGLRTSAESIVEGLRQAGCGTSLRDIWIEPLKDDPGHVAFDGLEVFDTTIIHTQPEPFFSESYKRGGLAERRPRTYRIGYWYWELDEIPASWLEKADEIDEIWVATRFVGDAARARFDKPVFEMLPGLELPRFNRLPRRHFGLPEGRFTFLFVFHMMSVMERKNPLGLIRAFRAAFGDRPEPLLVLKTSFGDRHPDTLREMREAAAGEGIEIIDAIYTQDETLSIIDCCDCYVSLHRSEGYGLTMAEAMLLGKPVIATAYSGNLDFMDAGNGLLVDAPVVTLEREYPPYPKGARWAEPSTDHAAACMRRVFENQDWARALGARAKADLTTRLSHATSGARMAERLREIDRMRRATPPSRPIRFPI